MSFPSASLYPESLLYPESYLAFDHRPIVQAKPVAVTDTDLYTVPSSAQAILSGITVCNQATTSATYRIAIRDGGAALATKHYIIYDKNVGGNKTDVENMGITLNATDVITVYSSTSNLSFCFFGVLCYI